MVSDSPPLSSWLAVSCPYAESLVHDLSVDIAGSFEEDLAKLQDDSIISDNVPAFVLAKLDPPSTNWVAFDFVPDKAQVREKACLRHYKRAPPFIINE